MHTLTATGELSGMEMTLCKDGKWRPAGSVENVKQFSSAEAAARHGQNIHSTGRMLHWTFTVTEEPVYAT